jgi:hypothetical protein
MRDEIFLIQSMGMIILHLVMIGFGPHGGSALYRSMRHPPAGNIRLPAA